MNKTFFGLLALLVVVIVGASVHAHYRVEFIPKTSVVSKVASSTLPIVVKASSSEAELQGFIKNMADDIQRAGGSPALAPAPGTAPTEISSVCTGGDSMNFDCYETYYTKLVQEQGVKEAFDDLKVRYAQNGYVVSQCHPITHVIGRVATNKYTDVAEAYTHGDPFCWSGYYHGVLEGVVGKIGGKHLGDSLNGICANLPGKATYNFDYFNCVHGLGHGVMAFTQDELFDALKLCDRLDGSWERESCYSGVFMENVIVDNKNHFTKYLKPTEPLYPCNAVDTKYKTPCYLMQTSYMLKVTNGDFAKVFGYCAKAEEAFRPTCYQSLGRDASGRSASDIVITRQTCEIGKGFEQRSNCVIGAVKDIISYFHSDVQAKEFCASLDSDLKETCRTTEEEYMKGLAP